MTHRDLPCPDRILYILPRRQPQLRRQERLRGCEQQRGHGAFGMVLRLEPYHEHVPVQPALASDQPGYRRDIHVHTHVRCVLRQPLESEAVPVHEPSNICKCRISSSENGLTEACSVQAEDGSQYNQTALLTDGKFDPAKYAELGVRCTSPPCCPH